MWVSRCVVRRQMFLVSPPKLDKRTGGTGSRRRTPRLRPGRSLQMADTNGNSLRRILIPRQKAGSLKQTKRGWIWVEPGLGGCGREGQALALALAHRYRALDDSLQIAGSLFLSLLLLRSAALSMSWNSFSLSQGIIAGTLGLVHTAREEQEGTKGNVGVDKRKKSVRYDRSFQLSPSVLIVKAPD